MSILFERKVESGSDLPPGHVRITTGIQPESSGAVYDRIEQLEDEVDHLRACIDQLLDMVDRQFNTSDHVDIIADRMSLFERRMQRVEDGLIDLNKADKRRAGDH